MAEPALRRVDENDSRYYEHPTRTEPVPDQPDFMRPARYVSVTQVLTIKAKPALVFWAGNVTAARAMDDLPKLMAGVLQQPGCGRSRAREEPFGCGTCVECTQAWLALTHHGEKMRRAREGTCAHDILEDWIKTGIWRYAPVLIGDPAVDQYVPTAEQMQPYLDALKAWVEDFGLLPEDFLAAECTVWNHRLKYAGTLDFIVRIHPRTRASAEFCARINYTNLRNAYGADTTAETPFYTAEQPLQPVTILGDLKSREGDTAEFYSENPLQLTGYRNAETMTPKGHTDVEIKMIETDGAAILLARFDPDADEGSARVSAYTFRPVVTDGRTMRAFEAAMMLHNWDAEHGAESTLVRAFPKPDGWKWAAPAPAPAAKRPPAKRAPAKKATARKTAPAEKAATAKPASPLADLRQGPGTWPDIPDDEIPF